MRSAAPGVVMAMEPGVDMAAWWAAGVPVAPPPPAPPMPPPMAPPMAPPMPPPMAPPMAVVAPVVAPVVVVICVDPTCKDAVAPPSLGRMATYLHV